MVIDTKKQHFIVGYMNAQNSADLEGVQCTSICKISKSPDSGGVHCSKHVRVYVSAQKGY